MSLRVKIIAIPLLMFTLAFIFRFAGMENAVATPVYAASSVSPMSSIALYDKEIPAPKIIAPKRSVGVEVKSVAASLSLPGVKTDFKAYMDYRTITDRKAPQWRYRELAYTDDNGFRKIADDYVVALGTYYAKGVGERFRVTLDTGTSFTVITGDIKDPAHTDPNNMYTPVFDNFGKTLGGCVLEFLVDTDKLHKTAVTLGTVSCYDTFEGNIKSIERL
jgi:hypothetical protein